MTLILQASSACVFSLSIPSLIYLALRASNHFSTILMRAEKIVRRIIAFHKFRWTLQNVCLTRSSIHDCNEALVTRPPQLPQPHGKR